MEALTYFLIILIVFLGLIIGVLLAFFAREEIKPGEKYLSLLQVSISLIAFVIFLNFLKIHFVLRILLYCTLLLLLTANDFNKWNRSELLYPIFAAMLFFASQHQNTFLYLSSIVFLYGLPTGSLAAKHYDILKDSLRVSIHHASFLIISLIFVLIRPLFENR